MKSTTAPVITQKSMGTGFIYVQLLTLALLNLINDFVNTPIEKRYPEKKYTIKTLSDNNDSYLIRTAGGNYFFGCLKMRDSYGDQVSFTKDEIEEMKLDDGLAIDWSKATITIEEDK